MLHKLIFLLIVAALISGCSLTADHWCIDDERDYPNRYWFTFVKNQY